MVNIQPHWPCGCSIFHSSNALSNRQLPNYQPCFFSWYNIKLLVTAVKNLVSCVSPLLTLLGTPGWWDERKYWEPVGQPTTKCVVISKETRSLVFFVCLFVNVSFWVQWYKLRVLVPNLVKRKELFAMNLKKQLLRPCVQGLSSSYPPGHSREVGRGENPETSCTAFNKSYGYQSGDVEFSFCLFVCLCFLSAMV